MSFFRRWKWPLVSVGAVLLLIAVVYSFFGRSEEKPKLALSEVLTRAKQGDVMEIDVSGDRLTVTMVDGEEYRSRKELDSNIIDVLQANGVEVGGEDGVVVDVHASTSALEDWLHLLGYVFWLAVAVLMLAAAYWVFRRARSSS